MPQDSIEFRNATLEDIDFLYTSLQKMSVEQNMADRFSLTKESLSNALFSKQPLAEILLTLSNGVPIGLAMFSMTHRNFDVFKSHGLYLHSLYVIPSFRRKNTATKIMEQLKKIARTRNCSRIDWMVCKDNNNGINFYKTLSDANEVDYVHYMRIKL